MTVLDDLGHPVDTPHPAQRVVSLVPSLTESVASVDRQALVGATDWCTHPAGLDTTRIRGTKNPDIPAITRLAPDIVLANKEENRRTDVERLRAAGIAVWVTDIQTVDQALTSLARLFKHALGWPEPTWLETARTRWRAEPPTLSRTAAIPIWRDPWMVVGNSTFTGDLARQIGLVNVFADAGRRYPHATIDEINRRKPDVVVLPDEPYHFSATDGPECFPDTSVVLVEGRLFTWYGPSLATARATLAHVLATPVAGADPC